MPVQEVTWHGGVVYVSLKMWLIFTVSNSVFRLVSGNVFSHFISQSISVTQKKKQERLLKSRGWRGFITHVCIICHFCLEVVSQRQLGLLFCLVNVSSLIQQVSQVLNFVPTTVILLSAPNYWLYKEQLHFNTHQLSTRPVIMPRAK